MADSPTLALRQVAELVHDLRHYMLQIEPTLCELAKGFNIPQDSRTLAKLHRLTRSALREIDDLLIGTKYQSSVPSLELGDLCLSEFLPQTVASFMQNAQASNVSLGAVSPSEALPIRGDVALLQRAMANLVSNALRHTAPGGAITVCGRRVENGVELSVTNTGEAIPHSEFKRLVEPFHSGGSLRAGLGLSIVASIARAHGGTLTLSSDSKGNTFTLTIPDQK